MHINYSNQSTIRGRVLAFLYFFTTTLITILQYIKLAEGTGCIDVQPLVYTGAMKMMTAREFTKLSSIFIGTKANATFL